MVVSCEFGRVESEGLLSEVRGQFGVSPLKIKYLKGKFGNSGHRGFLNPVKTEGVE